MTALRRWYGQRTCGICARSSGWDRYCCACREAAADLMGLIVPREEVVDATIDVILTAAGAAHRWCRRGAERRHPQRPCGPTGATLVFKRMSRIGSDGDDVK